MLVGHLSTQSVPQWRRKSRASEPKQTWPQILVLLLTSGTILGSYLTSKWVSLPCFIKQMKNTNLSEFMGKRYQRTCAQDWAKRLAPRLSRKGCWDCQELLNTFSSPHLWSGRHLSGTSVFPFRNSSQLSLGDLTFLTVYIIDSYLTINTS